MAANPKQLSLLPAPSLEHGGGVRKGKRKTSRPLDTKRAIHVVMRALRAKGEWSMVRKVHRDRIQALLERTAHATDVRVYRFSNVGNHLHLLIRAKKREGFQNFLRVFAAQTATLVTKARKGKPVGKFWDELAYSRVVSWGREFKKLQAYLSINLLEGKNLFRRGPHGSWVMMIPRGG